MDAPTDFAARYAAVHGRDARFDGQFFTAVRSTGISCRPSCPARTPKAENCTFYLTAAAAHQAGYRACRRCLPEATPGSPAWNLRQDVAARAMRLISDGVVDREGVPGLASRLGYSERHLGRVLHEELGAGPLALARAQRAQTARQLLVATALPVAEVAHAAGFASLRQFNDTVREVFAMTPSEVRARARSGERSLTERADAVAPGALSLRLAVRAPFDGAGVVDWLARRAVPGVEHVADGAYTRSLRLTHGPAVVTLRPGTADVMLTARLTDLADLPEALARVRRLLDLDADPEAIDAALAADARLAHAVSATPGIRLPGSVDAAEMVTRAIVGQQVTVAAATTAVGRLAAQLGEPLPPALVTAEVSSMFPAAAALAAGVEEAMGGPHARRRALAAAMAAIADGSLVLDAGRTVAQATADLEALPGIGPWTSHYVALRVLGATDILLTGDVAVRAGARALGIPDAPRDLVAATAAAAPWRSYVMMHLWRAASPNRGGADAHS
ncbi:MAG: DNA-3-methyladenine glycosylase 2 family protein [Demequina sp.]|uniref:DNA-3-methyladenine glycosylase 2 family protein n=1 Tax=Demequina sp. TaxID=2050685 RepID=UPI003A8A816E